MKLFITLVFALIGLNIFAKSPEKIERKLANINMDSSLVISALSKNGVVNNSQKMVNELTKVTSYKCADTIQNSELKDINLIHEKKDAKLFKFNAIRMCFDQEGPGVVEVHYDGVLRHIAGDLQATEVKIKLIQDAQD